MKPRILLSIVALVGAVGSVSSKANAQYCGTENASTLAEKSSCGSGGVLYGENTGNGHGVSGATAAAYGWAGVYGKSTATSSGVGVYGVANGTGAAGVNGETDTGNGVTGWASGANGHGVYGVVTTGGASSYGVYGYNQTGSGYAVYCKGDFKVTGTPHCAGCTAFTNDSDLRLKKNVQPLVGALDRLMQLRGVTFEWKDPAEHGNRTAVQRGFIAQEVEKVVPEWVGTDSKGFKTVNLTGLEPMLVESLRTLKVENDALKDRVKALEDNRRPLRAGLGEGSLGLGAVILLGGALMLSRRQRLNTQS